MSNHDNNWYRDVNEVTERLDSLHPDSNLDNKDDPFEELVYITLSNRTREEYYRRAFYRVKNLVEDWNRLPEVSDEDLETAIGESGLARKKTRTLKKAATFLQVEVGEVSLDFFEEMGTEEAEDFLLKMHGVGPKTAKCVLMYALDRPVFPIDTHCVRVCNRIGWLDTKARQYTKVEMQRIEERVPPKLRKTLHIRLVQHGRKVCVDDKPHCERCPLTDLCDHYATHCTNTKPC